MTDQEKELQELIERKRADLTERAGVLKSELGNIERELQAIEAYTRILSGAGIRPPTSAYRSPQQQARHRGRRPEEGGIRDQVMNALRQFGPMGRAEILDKIGKTGDDTAAVAVSNALVKLRQIGSVVRDETDKKYRYVDSPGQSQDNDDD